ncbi:MAG: hypothetical protein R3D90_06335 [Paracoccaceae bacterium]
MLDSDASFSFVPEFHTIRRAPTKGLARSSDLPLCAESFAACPDAASFVPTAGDQVTRDAAAPAAAPPRPEPAEPDAADLATADLPSPAAPAADTTSADPRGVTPRRPLRFTPARDGADHAPVTLPVLNLFANVFDDDGLHGPDIDPRLQRGRDRARACLAAHQADLAPEARNLWHDMDLDTAEDPAPAESRFIVTETECAATPAHPRRRTVRHLTPRAGTAARPEPKAEVLDPLQEHLHQVRDALYAEDPAADQAAPATGRVAALLLALAGVVLPLMALLAPRAAALRDRLAPPRPPLLLPRLSPRALAGCAVVASLGLTLSSAIL